jgi:plastocyanin
MRATVVLSVVLVASVIFAGCVGNFGSPKDEAPASTGGTPPTTTAGTPLTPPAPLPKLKFTVSPASSIDPWVTSGTTMDVQATVPADAKAPLTWTWGVAPLLGTAPITTKATGLDTGSKRADDYMAPGASSALTFSVAGVYQMHCHPHANFMRANVTVVDGLVGPKAYDVYIEDGATYSDFRFVPENLTVPTGSVVTYHNVGSQAHTATLLVQDPPVKVQAGVTGSKGTVTLAGNGWTRVVALLRDADGRVGQADYAIYVAPFPENYNKTFPADFTAGTPAQLDAAPSVAPPTTTSFKTDYNGTAFVNVTFLDVAEQNAPAGTSPAGTCSGEWHLQEQGSTQDTLTGAPGSSSSAHGRVLATTYNLVTKLRQGANCKASLDIRVLYDHTPPAILPYVDPESIPHQH